MRIDVSGMLKQLPTNSCAGNLIDSTIKLSLRNDGDSPPYIETKMKKYYHPMTKAGICNCPAPEIEECSSSICGRAWLLYDRGERV